MKIAVTDANIFIDLIWLDRIAGLFELGLEVVTPHEVMEELLHNQLDILQPYIESKQLVVHHLSDAAYLELDDWEVSNRLSFPDKTALYLAKKLDAMVLTGDNLFRKQAISLMLEAHGLLWIFEQWVLQGWIVSQEARELLGKLMLFNDRLPQKECQELIEKWAEQG
ncbi:MAG TPA: hypothetical protein PK228_18920 [Saprospiraceae bacterium]|nr:hypothetical protein [Saprospiraceae bacterium]